MKKFLNLSLTGTALVALTIGIWGCDQVTEPRPLALEPAEVQAGQSVAGFELVPGGSDRARTATARLGYWGGRVTVDGHQLIVPQGAVNTWTTFEVTPWTNGYVGVKLSATQVMADGRIVRVGEPGFERFHVDVVLTLSYGQSRGEIGDREDDLRIVRLGTSKGGIEWKDSHVDKRGRKVNASLQDFSDYGLAWPM
jgi:hypothetical protein